MFVILGILAYTYAAARPAFPLMDHALASFDASLGFHAPAIVTWIDQSALLSWIATKTYDSLGPQIWAIPVILACSGREDVAARFFLSVALISVVSSTISIFVPAVAIFQHFAIDVAAYQNLIDLGIFRFHHSFLSVRQDEIYVLTAGTTTGIVSFPSIHAALAIVCGYMAWQHPLIKYPGLILNVLMFVATVPIGGHYLADILAGVVVGVGTLWAVAKIDMDAWMQPRWAYVWLPAGVLGRQSRA